MSTTRQKKMLLPDSPRRRKIKQHQMIVATVTEEEGFNPPVPHTDTLRLLVAIFLIHAVVIGAIIGYDRMSGVTEETRTMKKDTRGEAVPSVLPPSAVNTDLLQKEYPIEEYATYEWRSGDSLPKVAEKLRVPQDLLVRLNMLDKGAQIATNTILRYPRQPAVKAVGIGVAGADGLPPVTAVAFEPPPPAGSLAASSPSIGLEMPGEAPFSLSPNIMHELAQGPDLGSGAVSAPDSPPPAQPVAEKTPAVQDQPPPAPPPVVKTAGEKPVPKAIPVPRSYTPPAPPAARKSAPPPAVKPAPQRQGASHVVRPGENLYRIAARYKVDVKSIQDANKLKNPDHIREGMKLLIPAK
ncbi:MAG TPA: hypothetical protein DIT64_13590 [Verrucomicrobiales bacterium]|nr:hypothetical protein [Verrucomicrobiales bacterium]